MDTLYTMLTILSLVIGVIVLISHIVGRREQKREHKFTMSQLSPQRILTPGEVEKFTTMYKKKIPGNMQICVYSHKGLMEYISFSVNGAETKQYTIGGVEIAHQSIDKLLRKPYQIDCESISKQNLTGFNSDIEKLQEEHGDELPVEAFNEISEKYSQDIEFIFLNNNMDSKAYLIKFNEWSV